MQADDEALELIARRAGGSMRDAQSLLDQLLAFSGQKLTVEASISLLGTANEERVAPSPARCWRKDAKQALEILGDVVESGPAARRTARSTDRILARSDGRQLRRPRGGRRQRPFQESRHSSLDRHAKKASLDTILAGMDILVTAKSATTFHSHGRALYRNGLGSTLPLDSRYPLPNRTAWRSGLPR